MQGREPGRERFRSKAEASKMLPSAAPDAGITDGDVARLRGLYKSGVTANLRGRRGEIACRMRQSLEGAGK